jgi:hypothetical protein
MKAMSENVPTMSDGHHADGPGEMATMMTSRRKLVIGTSVVAIAVAWYLFRPELLFIDQTVNESFPATASTSSSDMPQMKLATGTFRGLAHDTKGMATIYEVGGKRVLRLTGFETSNGPDVHVLLVAAKDAADDKTVKDAGYIDLGSLKGNVGDQNYDVPADVDLSEYQACTIWCNRFSVNFGTAPLMRADKDGMDAAADAPRAPVSLVAGEFRGLAHETKGMAAIYDVGEGERILRLTDFETSNGPDVHVLLVAAPDAADDATVKGAGYIDLGSLKGNVGDQNYEVPADVDLAKYQACTIWCNRFSVNFGTAPLAMR